MINWEAGKVIPTSKHAILRKLLDEKCEAEKVHGNLIPFYDDVASIGGNNEYVDTGDWFKDATAAIRHYGESMVEYPNGCILALKEVLGRGLIVQGHSDYKAMKPYIKIVDKLKVSEMGKFNTFTEPKKIREPEKAPVLGLFGSFFASYEQLFKEGSNAKE